MEWMIFTAGVLVGILLGADLCMRYRRPAAKAEKPEAVPLPEPEEAEHLREAAKRMEKQYAAMLAYNGYPKKSVRENDDDEI